MPSDARLLIVALALWAAPAGVLAEPACDAALAALREDYSGPPAHYALSGVGNPQRVKLFVNDAGPCLSRAYSRKSDQDGCGWFGISARGMPAPARPPAKETLEAFARSPIVDGSAGCPSLRRTTQRILGWRAPSKGSRVRRNGLYDYTSVGITLPVISAAQGEAIAWVEAQSGPLAGGGGVVLLRVDANGRWRMAARLPLVVS